MHKFDLCLQNKIHVVCRLLLQLVFNFVLVFSLLAFSLCCLVVSITFLHTLISAKLKESLHIAFVF